MPTVSLRLSEEELAQLHAWAHDSRRSVQKEIVWRLFSNGPINAAIGYVREPRDPITVRDDHFRPDPKR